jgi:hypothetical protein
VSTGVGDVDHDLAGELVRVLLDGVLDAGIVDGEDHNLTTDRRSRCKRSGTDAELVGEALGLGWVVVDDLDLVTSCDGSGADAAAHVARANNRDLHLLDLPLPVRASASQGRGAQARSIYVG